jgi:RHS repeat-associated protein
LTGLDYAVNRYYSSIWGRFLSPDPYGGSAILNNPDSFNRYAYVRNDPVNSIDPSGLVECGDLDVVGGGTLSDYINAGGDAGKLTRFVWAEGGSLTQSGGDQNALGLSMALIAPAIENRLAVANGQVAVAALDGNIYWGNGGTFNGAKTVRASILGYGGQGTTLSQELVRAAAGTGEVDAAGELVDDSALQDSLAVELGDPTRQIPGRVPVTMADGSTDYVTPECDRAILAMQATNTILRGASLNSQGYFVISRKAVGNSNPDPTRLGSLGTMGGTTFFGVGSYMYVQYPYRPNSPPIRVPHPPYRRPY